jgi:hypothetical protein
MLESAQAGIDTLISGLSASPNNLAEQLAAVGHSTVAETAVRPTAPDSSGLIQTLALAAILGLVVGLLSLRLPRRSARQYPTPRDSAGGWACRCLGGWTKIRAWCRGLGMPIPRVAGR